MKRMGSTTQKAKKKRETIWFNGNKEENKAFFFRFKQEQHQTNITLIVALEMGYAKRFVLIHKFVVVGFFFHLQFDL